MAEPLEYFFRDIKTGKDYGSYLANSVSQAREKMVKKVFRVSVEEAIAAKMYDDAMMIVTAKRPKLIAIAGVSSSIPDDVRIKESLRSIVACYKKGASNQLKLLDYLSLRINEAEALLDEIGTRV